ncbi:MAG: PLDc N-terminal domain-containing protein [Verrucomicrobiae bacterium]|nr:PLDc N-terminal domain-containing protein [Verrucomicrobiae bacterium]
MLAFMQGMGPAELLVILLMLAIFGLWIWAIIDVARRTDMSPNTKAIWVIALLLFGIATALVYCIVKLATRKSAVSQVKEL